MEDLEVDISSKPNSTSFLDRSYSVRHDSSSSKKNFFSRSVFGKKLSGFLHTKSENSNPNSVDEGRVKKLCNSFESSSDAGDNNSNSSMKSLIGDNRRTMSFRQSGIVQARTLLFNNRIRLPGTEDKIVVYFTSLRGIRRTYEDCCAVRNIFGGFRVSVDERDISMDSGYRRELQSVLREKTVSLPHVFIRGRYIGGAEEIKMLLEIGELARLLEGFPVRDPRLVCETCGAARFVPCLNCNGSRKVFEEDEGQLIRCPECNENGLIRCPSCNS
ncbi:hypothetical protein NE237_008685 [Protea cynaroides]|uniref:Glutaredoxin domain-containing protein n=1 Tax=Protea cynaroides TaxID=273540 RepID=A0A9Q0QZJ8_9MAGN|nr:hypothetical protein NE237_008685 [Protea cynaroides]